MNFKRERTSALQYKTEMYFSNILLSYKTKTKSAAMVPSNTEKVEYLERLTKLAQKVLELQQLNSTKIEMRK